MFAFNEALQRARIPTYTWFNQVEYSQVVVISRLLTKKSNAKQLVNNHSNILMKAAKAVNLEVIRIKGLRHWQKLNIYGMSLVRYFGKKKVEILYYKIELFMGI